ncbi:MAG: SPFH domain-containing protein, partial [Actinobacteria bacterium]|nr:SPFH domain-containing protein [Actinomycetota bacterium]
MHARGIIIVVVLGVAVAASSLVFYAIDETEVGVLTQFGRPIAAVTTSGLHAKWPDPVQTIKRFDRRLQVYTPPEKEYLTSDKKAIRVESYITWRLVDPTRFLVSVGDKGGAVMRLADIVTSELAAALG